VPAAAPPERGAPAEPLSPEEAGAWMNAFLSGDAAATDRAGEPGDAPEQEH
jgi:hypothetical protein